MVSTGLSPGLEALGLGQGLRVGNLWLLGGLVVM